MSTPKSNSLTTTTEVNGVVVIFLFDFLPKHRTWAWLRLMQGNSGLFKIFQGLRFAKVMGSGESGGFGLRPSSTHQGLILLFDNLSNATECIKSSEIKSYREKTKEFWQGVLTVNSCRGSWDQKVWNSQDIGISPLPNQELTPYIASLTRASVKASKAMNFWRFAPAAQVDLQKANGCELAVGLGEAPIVRQCTFSIWSDTQSLISYAHGGAHLRAITAAQKNNFFSESMFVRMNVLHMFGNWMGKSFDINTNFIKPFALNS
jgi:spheroidene monooxygenase